MKSPSVVVLMVLVLAGAAAVQPQAWHGYHGRTQSVQGETMTLQTDDAEVLPFNLSNVRADVRQLVAPGERITVVAWPGGPNQCDAHLVQLERPLPWVEVDGQEQWQRVHGHAQNVLGSQLTFRADDGRILNVDMTRVNPNVQRALTPGQGATVVGFPGPRPNAFTAHYIQQDSSDRARSSQPAALPR